MDTAQPVHSIDVTGFTCVPWNISLYDTLETVTKTQESTILKSYSECFVTQERRHFFYHFVASEERPSWSRKSRETRTAKVTFSFGSLADNLCHRHITPWFSKVCKGALLADLPTALDWPHTCTSQRAPQALPLAGRQQHKGLHVSFVYWFRHTSGDYYNIQMTIWDWRLT